MLQDFPIYAYIPARDVARARRFYEQKVGLPPGKEMAGGVYYDFAGGTACFLYQTDNAGTSKASQAFWAVKDIERIVTRLRERGVVFEEYDTPGMKSRDGIMEDEDGVRAAWFKDTEGNIMALIEGAPRR